MIRAVLAQCADILLDLAPNGVYTAEDITALAGTLLPYRFTLTYCYVIYFSVALFRQVALPSR